MTRPDASPTPTLYIFTISHYCEKARWALDYLGVDYHLEHVAPLFHVLLAKKLGLDARTLPVLTSGAETVQGSAAIIDWAEQRASSDKRLTPDQDVEQCRSIEKRLDDVAGVHTRRWFYSEAMVEHPQAVKPVFLSHLPWWQRIVIGGAWMSIRGKMIEKMDLGREQEDDSRAIIEKELDWLDGLLADGRPFLVGDRFSRADLTAASLLSRMASPPQHPAYDYMFMPPRMGVTQELWNDRPVLEWIRGLYRQYR